MKLMKPFLIGAGVGIIITFLLSAGEFLGAQAEKPPTPSTRQWMIPVDNISCCQMNVHIIETTGVCLYIAVDPGSIAITSQLKRQLGTGVGCQ